jgi:hypothetical protein
MSLECGAAHPTGPGDARPGLDQGRTSGTSQAAVAVADSGLSDTEWAGIDRVGGETAARSVHWKPDPRQITSKVVGLFLLTLLERIVLADQISSP